MADSKITALTALTAADPANDMIPIVDVSDTPPASGNTKRISINNILAASGTATLASAAITGNLTVQSNVNAPANVSLRYGPSAATWAGLRFDATNQTFLDSDIGISFRTGGATSFTTAYQIGATGISTWSVSGSTAMTLNATGLGVGRTPSYKLDVAGVGNFDQLRIAAAAATKIDLVNSTTAVTYSLFNANTASNGFNGFGIFNGTSYDLQIVNGNVGIGIAPSYKLDVRGSDNSVIAQFGGTNRQVRLSTSAVSAVDNASFNFIHTSGSGRFTFQNNSGTQTMLTIDDNGNNILRMPVTPPTLGVNLEGTFNLTSNTNLRISVRGSDGVTRVANITLA